MTKLSTIFPSVKIKTPNPFPSSSPKPTKLSQPRNPIAGSKPTSSWSVYLIISTNTPIKTYVGVTTSFSRRLKQHNGELKGGAKATRSGRPWICACLIQGFKDRSEASEFEAKWKIFSRKLPRKKEKDDSTKQANESPIPLLQHRQRALSRVEDSFDCNHLQIDWHISPFRCQFCNEKKLL